jgi:hypothetical protein
MTKQEIQAAIEKTPDEFPLIDKLPSRMTSLAMLLCAEFAQLLPSYKAAETIIGKHLGMKVSDTYIERVTGYAGGRTGRLNPACTPTKAAAWTPPSAARSSKPPDLPRIWKRALRLWRP